MLSEKEVMDLNERILGHISLMEKYRVYSQQCPDQQVRDLVSRHQQVLQNHYQQMIGFMQNAQSMQGVQGFQPGLQGVAATQAQWRLS